MYVHRQFKRTAQHAAERRLLIYLPQETRGDAKNMMHSGPAGNEDKLHRCILVPFITFAAAFERMRWSMIKYVYPHIYSGGEHFEHLL
jgi:hypothetical protein